MKWVHRSYNAIIRAVFSYKFLARLGWILPILALFPLAPAFAEPQLVTIINSVGKTLQIVIAIVFSLAVIYFGWGIVQLIAAAGNPQAVIKAKGIITYGLIAMTVLASMVGIIQIFQNYFGVSGGGSITPPQFVPK